MAVSLHPPPRAIPLIVTRRFGVHLVIPVFGPQTAYLKSLVARDRDLPPVQFHVLLTVYDTVPFAAYSLSQSTS